MTAGHAVEKPRHGANQIMHSVPPTTRSSSSEKGNGLVEVTLQINTEPSFFKREILGATKISPHPSSKTPRSLECSRSAEAEDSSRGHRETRNWFLCIPMTLRLMPRNPQNLFLGGQESNKGFRKGLRRVDKLRETSRSRWKARRGSPGSSSRTPDLAAALVASPSPESHLGVQSSPPTRRAANDRLTGAGDSILARAGRRLPGRQSSRIRGGGERGQDAPSPRRPDPTITPVGRPPSRAAGAPRAATPPPRVTWRRPRPVASHAQAGKGLTDTISKAPKMADVSSRPGVTPALPPAAPQPISGKTPPPSRK